MLHDLFEEERRHVTLGPGAALMGGFVRDIADHLIQNIHELSARTPFRHMETSGGKRMSVAMLSCGHLGWITDRTGYRYTDFDPLTGKAWPAFPALFLDLAQRAAQEAGFRSFVPDSCLINRYQPGARMSLHQDMDERDLTAPIVSVSLGLPAIFLWGGLHRTIRPRRHQVLHGDVVVWGGASRMIFHGVDVLKNGQHPATGDIRFNLTFRKVS